MKTPLLLSLLSIALPAAASPYTLHEWGTFTTVSGSDGRLLSGLEREEEPLPTSVQSLDQLYAVNVRSPFSKGWSIDRELQNVTVKMETPVIYFYTEQPMHASVKVGFHGGSISQWFPPRTSGEIAPDPGVKLPKANARELPTVRPVNFASNYEGSIAWDIDIIPSSAADQSLMFRGDENPTWLYPRMTDSALVRTKDGSTEKYLFYRGLGNFVPAVSFTTSENGNIVVHNNSKQAMPAMMLFNHEPGGLKDGTYRGPKVSTLRVGPVAAGDSKTIALTSLLPQEKWQKSVYQEMSQLLQDQGLFRKEADAMVQTWWKSYFSHPGLRAFWIVPQESLEAVLPLAVVPAPEKSVRVMVGRSEILTQEFEKQLAQAFKGATEEGRQNPWAQDRFFQPYAKRVEELTKRTAQR